MIDKRLVDTGQFVRAGTVLANLVDTSRLKLRFKVYESESLQARPGEPVTFKVGAVAGRDFQGRIYHVGEVADPATRQVEVLAWVQNPGVLKPGFFAEVELPAESVWYGLPLVIGSGLYILYILGLCILRPSAGPRIPPSPDEPDFLEKCRISIVALWPPMLLITSVLGSMLFGVAAPTEAAALGALGALLLSIIYGDFTLRVLHESLLKTLKVTVMILTILMAGNMFAGVFIAGGGVQTTEQFIQAAQLGPWLTLSLFLLVSFLAGFILDWISILLIFILMPDSFAVAKKTAGGKAAATAPAKH